MSTETHREEQNEIETVVVPLPSNINTALIEDYIPDATNNLGKANGNIYRRKPELPNVHDGQLMIRLNKKRFIVVDYTFVPTDADIQYMANSNMWLHNGSGQRQCINRECTKVGMPVMLYDSHPTEPISLYVRSGMCFMCQRVLNEKRRSERKKVKENKKKDSGEFTNVSATSISLSSTLNIVRQGIMRPFPAPLPSPATTRDYRHPNDKNLPNSIVGFDTDLHHMPHLPRNLATKRPKLNNNNNNEILDLNPDAIIINNGIPTSLEGREGMMMKLHPRLHGSNYNYKHIMKDLISISESAVNGINDLADTVKSMPDLDIDIINNDVSSAVHGEEDSQKQQDGNNNNALAIYQKTFTYMSQAIFLLSQWKESWDCAVVAQTEAVQKTNTGVYCADTVASAAAVAQCVSSTLNTHNNNSDSKVINVNANQYSNSNQHPNQATTMNVYGPSDLLPGSVVMDLEETIGTMPTKKSNDYTNTNINSTTMTTKGNSNRVEKKKTDLEVCGECQV